MDSVEGLNTENLAEGLRRVVARLESSADDLNALDGKLGDGDLGVTMTRGARQVLEALPSFSPDLGQALTTCAKAFTKVSGSSFGTLLAGALMAMAKEAGQRTSIPWSETSRFFRLAADSVAARGKAFLGDKTVLDALDAAARASEKLHSPQDILAAALEATGGEIDRLRDSPARIGRARMFPDRSRGLNDPGMEAFRVILEGLAGKP